MLIKVYYVVFINATISSLFFKVIILFTKKILVDKQVWLWYYEL